MTESRAKNMNIRSITLGVSWENQDKQFLTNEVKSFMKCSKTIFEKSSIGVRTTRISMPPLNYHKNFSRAGARSMINWISDVCNDVDVRWFCVPFDYIKDDNIDLNTLVATDIVTNYSNAFINLIVADNDKINAKSAISASKIIKTASRLSNNGFDNFRVGVSTNCGSSTPFFPFSYHNGEKIGFSLALESVDLFIEVIQAFIHEGIERVRQELVLSMRKELSQINKLALKIESETGFDFRGIDASLAPFPNGESSVGRIIELLGVDDFGSSGTLFFTSFLTNIIKNSLAQSGVKTAGFNGVMYSLLEDDILALRAKQKNFNIESLSLFSSVCGCGIDMVPVPGDILEEELSAMIVDVAAMANILNKPLGFRILPIPSKKANELTNFNYDFLVDTRIMDIRNRGFIDMLAEKSSFTYLDEYNLRL